MFANKEIDLDFLDSCCSEVVLPEEVTNKGRRTVIEERSALVSNLSKFGVVYGFNTLTGHRDDVVFSELDVEKFNHSVLESHCIGYAPWFSEREVDYLVFAKIYSFSLGGTGVSSGVFDTLCSAWLDRRISAVKIPCFDSYSSGDVIPGAHLAHFLWHNIRCDFEIGDMMAMINGNYIHSGYALSIRRSLAAFFDDLMCTLANSLSVVGMGVEWMGRLLSIVDQCYPKKSFVFRSLQANHKPSLQQVSVSFRAIPELIQACRMAMLFFDEVLASCFSKCSANPLFLNCGKNVVSQASFLSPELSLASSQLIDSLQYSAWQSLRRISFMLSPLSGNPQDAAGGKLDLGLIQVPKRLQARLDAQRLASSTRPFALGSGSSYGIEDSWTYGVLLISQLKEFIQLMREMLVEESAVAEYIMQVEKGKKPSYNEIAEQIAFSRKFDYFN
ncbi:MAG: aromatic amino acid lyase [Pseudomonadota bacterium]